MLAPPTASSATCCTSGKQAQDPGRAGEAQVSICSLLSKKISPFFSIWILTWITLSSLRFRSSRSGRLSLHGDIRLLFSRRSLELDTGLPYELQAVTEAPHNPRYSPLP